ncbi:SprT family zinc-dependent metalloprotease [Clostridium sp. AM58-1XD]|uniref:M48 family metallopeptidase n=1 Tax=Clostridium sp. AM58-1XD TaxID=2292307 RepID=UPI000E4BD04A|nr:SprT family zinc-dependent metalloprotease [Clostridium sp. AM58-1XD]RGY98923.1 M48 family peptidase [Clostridium sp. AM58-1XD]
MEMKELWVEWRDRKIRAEVIYSARKTMSLEVNSEAQVKVRVPRAAKDNQIRDFVEMKKCWIVEKYLFMKRRAEKKERLPVPDYVENPELEKEYRKHARKRIEEQAAYFADIMGVRYGRIAIRAAKSRWGSCSGAGNLNFHWKLILMPPEILDYVVVHELAHRKQMNHSPQFWAEVGKILPDYKRRRQWLKEHGSSV